MSSKTFTDATPEGAGDEHGHTLLARRVNEIGWELRAYLMPYYGATLEFVQVNHPDGTTSYFRAGDDGLPVAGPFGGGYSWTVPKYVVKETHEMLSTAFASETPEEVAA